MKHFKLIVTSLFLSFSAFANPGDTTVVTSHSDFIIRTNPSTGNSAYPAWTVFPAEGSNFHKVWMTLDFKCPPGENCGEWDYLDYVFLRRKGGVNEVSMDIELARFITPYGNTFNQSWTANWEIDMTDFEQLLRDSVEIEYIHGGFETNVGRGWLIDLRFHFIEGTPARNLISVNPLWNGGFAFGNANNPINDQLQTQEIVTSEQTKSLRFRINQTGHGADDPQLCAEFCPMNRQLYRNGSEFDNRLVWRDDCGLNPVFPQGGTWVYNRGNWCPGDMVFPFAADFEVNGNESIQFDMEMENYSGTGGANYVIRSYALEFSEPNFTVDASIDDIMAPSKKHMYKRFNPICGQPQLMIRNNGKEEVTSIGFNYGPVGGEMSAYTWTGNIGFMKSQEILLPPTVKWGAEEGEFMVRIVSVNGIEDENPLNNTYYSEFEAPLEIPEERFVVNLRTNNAANENYWIVLNDQGEEIVRKDNFEANTTYSDTLDLPWGCYTFILEDEGNDGLSFWANNDGSGFLRFRRASTMSVFKAYPGDFGQRLIVPFTLGGVLSNPSIENTSGFDVYPNPATNEVFISSLSQDNRINRIELISLSGQVLLYQNIETNGSSPISLNTSNIASGIYLISVITDKTSTYKRVIIN